MNRIHFSSAFSLLRPFARVMVLITLAIHSLTAHAVADDTSVPAFDILEYEIHGNTR